MKTLVPAPRRSGWIPKGETVVVSGRAIGGMIYVGTPPLVRDDYAREKSRAFIDPSLQVAKRGTDRDGSHMPYWPGYSNIPASSRATYLDWLASGCRDASYDCGYMFLYFYGLERRFFVDAPDDQEKKDILAEARRLKDLYTENHSVQRYLGEFISVAKTIAEAPEGLDPIYDNPGWDLPLSLKMAIGAKFLADVPLSADWLLSWFLCHPEKRLRTPAERCREEFLALFKVRFSQRYPGGLKSRKPTRPMKETYRAASGEFTIEIEPKIDGELVPDISGARKPVAIAQEIADEAMIELDKLSRFLGRAPDGRGTLEAHALLPSDLWPSFPSAALDELKDWATGRVKAGGLVPAVDVVARLEGHRPDKLTKRQLTDSADALARIGFGMAPDPRFALRGPKADEPVVLFELGEAVDRLEEVTSAYRVALIELALGTFIAHADGEIVEAERNALEQRIEALENVTDAERKRLFANLQWLLATPPDLPLLRRKLKEMAPEHQKAFREIVVAIAHSDASIQAGEVAGIEKIYKALGLDPSDVYSDIHSGGTRDGPIRVRRAEPGAPGESIPAESDEGGSRIALDPSRIEAITKNTAEVSSVLGAIFADDLATDDDATTPKADASRFPGLDAKHAAFVEDLIAREHWSEDEFETLAGTHGLLPSGALETINEWAFDNHNEALIDAYEGYDIEPQIAEALKSTPELETA
ncbi:MAG: TerB N-terminal domain-containing protein [Fulvimarina manganoxydans]|uniref:tellurite resistance TerB family protein n=1 Tax=Fulvimarina manganoxydans TaxID=937218 RepID=UPI0023523935|nr:TerB N-terminal domain-containing protein [Fulvimarina manganoxydans]MCK5930965.1 TerB N-terminal domain-containing protein [Fulvimarina manganoxydans]